MDKIQLHVSVPASEIPWDKLPKMVKLESITGDEAETVLNLSVPDKGFVIPITAWVRGYDDVAEVTFADIYDVISDTASHTLHAWVDGLHFAHRLVTEGRFPADG